MKYLLIAVAAIVVIGGGFWYLQSQGTPLIPLSGTFTGGQAAVGAAVGANGEYTGSIFSLAESGKSYKCTITTVAEGISVKGTVYVSGKNVRGDFDTTVPVAGAMQAHVITTTDSVYTWTSMSTQGFKSARTDSGTGGVATAPGQALDLNQSYAYNCVLSATDAATFTPHANITFTTTP